MWSEGGGNVISKLLNISKDSLVISDEEIQNFRVRKLSRVLNCAQSQLKTRKKPFIICRKTGQLEQSGVDNLEHVHEHDVRSERNFVIKPNVLSFLLWFFHFPPTFYDRKHNILWAFSFRKLSDSQNPQNNFLCTFIMVSRSSSFSFYFYSESFQQNKILEKMWTHIYLLLQLATEHSTKPKNAGFHITKIFSLECTNTRWKRSIFPFFNKCDSSNIFSVPRCPTFKSPDSIHLHSWLWKW